MTEGESGALDPRVRALLVCPGCGGELEDVEGGLRCPADGVIYPVVAGIPELVPECARKG